MLDRDKLIAELKRDEGFRSKAYLDTEGIWTIGVGRNLQDVGISEQEADILLSNDIDVATNELGRAFHWFDDLDDRRQRVMVNMCFNLGITRLFGFRKFLKAMEDGDWDTASTEMMDSRWAKQVGQRAERLRDMVSDGSV